jgi:hypothetical protein
MISIARKTRGHLPVAQEIMDDRCFQLIDASVWFDADHHVTPPT